MALLGLDNRGVFSESWSVPSKEFPKHKIEPKISLVQYSHFP